PPHARTRLCPARRPGRGGQPWSASVLVQAEIRTGSPHPGIRTEQDAHATIPGLLADHRVRGAAKSLLRPVQVPARAALAAGEGWKHLHHAAVTEHDSVRRATTGLRAIDKKR